MSEIPTPTQDLVALDRVTEIASDAGLCTSGLVVLLERLREPILTDRKRRQALGRALATEWKWVDQDSEGYDEIAGHLLAAIASVGAEIVWPSPDSAETPESPAADATAPGAVTSASRCQATTVDPSDKTGCAVWCELPNSHAGRHFAHVRFVEPSISRAPVPTVHWADPESSAREKILAELAATQAHFQIPAAPRELVAEAFKLAHKTDDAERGVDVFLRENLLGAAARLIEAIEWMDSIDA
ncbi:hypothetical protein OG874_00200 [Nocardia sp. NBC_00565]|uniref:hypothetical protein n=1 Tax=Nocardia sp. NBC_00565 TaxID=2975993 RepID=UPI002E805409|nr:hypothetical protein [Nocardia sp. NBC_00565]WUC03675.1 hypothetical protein OG874_00200 [Nocardia sp. NBC_00565]